MPRLLALGILKHPLHRQFQWLECTKEQLETLQNHSLGSVEICPQPFLKQSQEKTANLIHVGLGDVSASCSLKAARLSTEIV